MCIFLFIFIIVNITLCLVAGLLFCISSVPVFLALSIWWPSLLVNLDQRCALLYLVCAARCTCSFIAIACLEFCDYTSSFLNWICLRLPAWNTTWQSWSLAVVFSQHVCRPLLDSFERGNNCNHQWNTTRIGVRPSAILNRCQLVIL